MAEETANIYRVNKLLELEAADWQRQLEKAVGGFKVRSPVPFYFSLYGVSEWSLWLFQGFSDKSLSVYEASCVLYRYEKRTGQVVGLSELESGELRSKLTKDDYNIKDMVSPTYSIIPTL